MERCVAFLSLRVMDAMSDPLSENEVKLKHMETNGDQWRPGTWLLLKGEEWSNEYVLTQT